MTAGRRFTGLSPRQFGKPITGPRPEEAGRSTPQPCPRVSIWRWAYSLAPEQVLQHMPAATGPG
ncbi:hypothetical protein ADK64_15180 [Streptomyces sp. MMG1121]|nr:hypothetical protein ADK64_15180 [Streptomyces sp. MMG1121]